ncbi:hypothetical protein H0Z60_08055 [Ectothiorhodospiraceae bacterium WFHF3C12]|nr:hypothetical protein [Ectothiorhodospiraceae bacterium WFHF3C12]
MKVTDVDAQGRPILIEVAVAGDEARRRGIRLDVNPDEAPSAAAAGQKPDEAGLEQYLRERIEQAVRKALPQATQETLERLRRERHWHDDESR